MKHYTEIDSQEQAQSLLQDVATIRFYAFQNINFNLIEKRYATFHDCLFIGCRLTPEMRHGLNDSNTVLTSMHVPYNTFRTSLYNASTLYDRFIPSNESTIDSCYDTIVYRHYLSTGILSDNIHETLARTLHDHSMSDALHDFLGNYREHDIVAIMGGHALLRTDPIYREIVFIAKSLTEQGKLMASGGGPGAMEATHLGAWMAGFDNRQTDMALDMLKCSPSFTDGKWLRSAFEVMQRFPQKKHCSIGIPTWLYGHEPATPFATHIAKYFENSLREDGLLTIAKGGVIYAPGSAGTMQEIFQDAAQNHYTTMGYASPMIFLGTDYWNDEIPVYPLLCDMMKNGRYRNLLLSITDCRQDVIDTIMSFLPARQNNQ